MTDDCHRKISSIANKYVRTRVQFEKGDVDMDAGLDEGMRQVLGRCAVISAMEEGLEALRRDFHQYAKRFDEYLTGTLPDAATEDMNWRYGISANDRNSPGGRAAAAEAQRVLTKSIITPAGDQIPWMRLLAPYITPPAAPAQQQQHAPLLPSIRRTRVTVGGAAKPAKPAKPAAGARRTRTSPARKTARS